MSSEKQIAANRANAARSTGPHTNSGKARSRINAWKHGLRAEKVVIAGEDAEDLHAIQRALWEEHQPEPGTESLLVERLAHYAWRMRRAVVFEAALLGRGTYPTTKIGLCTRKCRVDSAALRDGNGECLVSYAAAAAFSARPATEKRGQPHRSRKPGRDPHPTDHTRRRGGIAELLDPRVAVKRAPAGASNFRLRRATYNNASRPRGYQTNPIAAMQHSEGCRRSERWANPVWPICELQFLPPPQLSGKLLFLLKV